MAVSCGKKPLSWPWESATSFPCISVWLVLKTWIVQWKELEKEEESGKVFIRYLYHIPNQPGPRRAITFAQQHLRTNPSIDRSKSRSEKTTRRTNTFYLQLLFINLRDLFPTSGLHRSDFIAYRQPGMYRCCVGRNGNHWSCHRLHLVSGRAGNDDFGWFREKIWPNITNLLRCRSVSLFFFHTRKSDSQGSEGAPTSASLGKDSTQAFQTRPAFHFGKVFRHHRFLSLPSRERGLLEGGNFQRNQPKPKYILQAFRKRQ